METKQISATQSRIANILANSEKSAKAVIKTITDNVEIRRKATPNDEVLVNGVRQYPANISVSYKTDEAVEMINSTFGIDLAATVELAKDKLSKKSSGFEKVEEVAFAMKTANVTKSLTKKASEENLG